MKRYAPSDYMVDVEDDSTHESESGLYVAVEDLPKWIPVSERLPPEGQRVIACLLTKYLKDARPDVGEALFSQGWFETDWGCYPATHWMPLPEPPEV